MKQSLSRSYLCGKAALLLWLLSVCIYKEGKSQQVAEQNSGQWLVGLGIAAGKLFVADKSFSSRTYNGVSPGGFLYARYNKNNKVHALQVNYQSGELKTDVSPHTDMKQAVFTADYARLYPVGYGSSGAFNFRGGPGVNLLYSKRDFKGFVNNSESFESAISISGVAEVSYHFNGNENGVFLSDQFILPLVSFITQPVFGDGYTTGSSVTDKYIGGFSSFVRIVNRFSIEKNLSGRQRLALCYYWDYFQATHLREVKLAKHQLALSYSLII